MFKIISAIIFFVISLAVTNVYASYDEEVAIINQGMPKSVKLFNRRQIECNHWGGEEPYDKARGLEIAAAAKKLKCDALESDEKKLLKKYKSKPSVIDSINKAKAFI
ncbi:MAG: hypothetical protein H7Z20_01475 [Bdellovibrio sp.]|nr:hypothetical protein [Methylotenera sp.]